MSEAHTPDVADVLDRYALKQPQVAEKLASGVVNDNWLVVCPDGGEYILRAYRRVRDPERVQFQLCFQEFLRDQGFPTGEVLKTAAGDLLVTAAGVPWALFAVAEGEEFDFARLPQAVEAGRRLAELHEVAAGYDGPLAPVTAGEFDFEPLFAPPSSHIWRNSVLGNAHDEHLNRLFPGPEFAEELACFQDSGVAPRLASLRLSRPEHALPRRRDVRPLRLRFRD